MASGTFLTIYPYPLTNLSVTSSSTTYNIMDNGSYYQVELVIGKQSPVVTISADGYESQTVTISGNTTVTLTQIQEISKLSNGTDTYNIRDDVARESISNLATVATSGSYNDLSNKLTAFNGADGTSVGTSGLVPAPTATDNTKFLKGDGTWATVSGGGQASIDNSTITENTNNQLQTVGIINQNTTSGAISPLKVWNGTEEQWNTGGGSQLWYNWTSGFDTAWTSQTSGTSVLLLSIAYGNGKYIAVGNTGTILSSTDKGTTWTAETSNVSTNLCKVKFLNGKFWVVGANGVMLTSTGNGVWESITTGKSVTLNDIIYIGNDTYICCGNKSGGYATIIKTTNGGISWSNGLDDNTDYGIDCDACKIIYYNNNYYIVTTGSYSPGSYSDLQLYKRFYEDGYYFWDYITGKTEVIADAEIINNKLYVVGSGGLVKYASNLSVDYPTFTNITSGTNNNLLNIMNANNKIIVVGLNGTIISSSDNGSTWIAETSGVSTNLQQTASTNNEFIVVGSSGTILSSSQSQVFTSEANPTTESTIYSEPEISSALTVTSVGTDTITLSDTITYTYNSSGNQTTTQNIGETHSDWLCNINNVGIKIGTTNVTSNSSFVGASGSTDGTKGLVPAPSISDSAKFLKGDGTWSYPTISIDQTFDGTSTNPQSGKAINSQNFIRNNPGSAGPDSIAIGQNASYGTYNISAIAIGQYATTSYYRAVAIGPYAKASGGGSDAVGGIAIGESAEVRSYGIQIGPGINTGGKFCVGFGASDGNSGYLNFELLSSSGKIPNDRINGVSGSFTSQDGKTITVTNGIITNIVSTSNVNLTFTVPDETEVDSLIVNGTSYSGEDFDNDALTLQFPSGTSITWSITTYRVNADPSQGSLTLTSDTTVQIGFTK